jgi:hypothetical protein
MFTNVNFSTHKKIHFQQKKVPEAKKCQKFGFFGKLTINNLEDAEKCWFSKRQLSGMYVECKA